MAIWQLFKADYMTEFPFYFFQSLDYVVNDLLLEAVVGFYLFCPNRPCSK